MKMNSKLFVLFSTALLLSSPVASAASKVDGDKPTFDDLQSPNIQLANNKRFTPNDWLEVEAKIKVQLSPEPKSKTAKEVIVKWYVAVKNPEKPGTFLLLTKSITHINVPLNEDIYSSIYLSPNSIRLLTGSPRGGKNAVELVGYEVFVDGEEKKTNTNKGKDKWWTMKSDKISEDSSIPLLSKNDTPFSIFWYDRYAEIKPENR